MGNKSVLKAASLTAIAAAASILLLVMLPTDARDKVLKAIAEGTMLGGVYGLLALGVVVVYKSTKVFNLTFGALIMFLSYFAWWLGASVGLPPWLAGALALIGGVIIGLAINRVFMIPLIGDPGMGSFIVTMVLGLSVINGLAVLLFKGSPEIMPGLFPSGASTLGPVTISHTWLVAFAVAIAMFAAFIAFFRFTRTGLKMRAVSEDPVIAQSLGVGVRRILDISWVTAGGMAAVCGILLGSMFAVTTGMSGFALSRGFPVLLLGGMDSLPGALLGAFIIGITEALSSAFIDPHVTGFREILPYVVMIVILILRPNGLLGSRDIRRI